MKTVTIGLSIHRPEMMPLVFDLMRRHEAIFLEEPPTPGFQKMLRGDLPIDEYLMPVDVEYPEFSRSMCRRLQVLFQDGKKVFQVEPFLDKLIAIHLFFAQGNSPADLKKDSDQHSVYLAERNATGALLRYYKTVMTGSFEATIEAVKSFARLDAARFRLRDTLRARELVGRLEKFESCFIEAGVIHYYLVTLLRRSLSPAIRLRPVFIADAAANAIDQKHRLVAPGDHLTLHYTFHPHFSNPGRENLLAAQSLIYSKIIGKEEQIPDTERYPHLRDEARCIEIARSLSLADCRRLYPPLLRAGTSQASKIVDEYLRLSNRKGQRRASV